MSRTRLPETMPTMYFRPLLLLLLALLLSSSSSLPHGESGDQEALLAFKEGLSDHSGSLSSWNTTNGDFCRWTGVACSRRHPGRVSSLYLPSRGLVGSISPAIGNLTFLHMLQLDSNMLSGEIPRTIGQLCRLRHLNLSNNSIRGEIPEDLCNCSSLVTMTLVKNQLRGEIPAALGSLSRLQLFYLTTNNLVGGIPASFGNLSSLAKLSLYGNKLEGTIPESLSRLARLRLIQVARNNLSGTVPPLFFNMSALEFFGVGSNRLQGGIPPDAGTNLPALEELHLGNNYLSGRIPSSLANSTKIQLLSLARNNFHGRVAPEIGKLCPVRVELGTNMLQADDAEGWEFLRFFANCTRLQLLDLNSNNLGGVLPSYVANFSRQIQRLSMAGNGIAGTIPPGIGNLVNLTDLELGGNKLHGPIPEEIGRLTNLQTLLLKQNDLSGHIPSSFGNLTLLPSLDLSFNTLSGSIPVEIFNLPSLTDFLSLSGNYLSGVIPSQVGKLKNIASLDLSKNSLSGEIPGTLGDCASLVYLALDDNSFTGSIPPSLGNLRGMSKLNLTRNALSGSIPRELAKMNGLQQLYLAQNNLSGGIPQLFQNASALTELDLSFNHLDGEVPSSGVFANMSGFLVVGNDELCGGIPELKLPPCQAKPAKQKEKLLLSVLLPVAGIAICLCLVLSALFLSKRKITVKEMEIGGLCVLDDKYPRVSYFELFEATDGFAPANLIGAGKYGSIYKGNLSLPSAGNSVVAVKVFNLHQTGSSRSFLAECMVLRRVKHRNLINIITSCSSVDSRGDEFRALVFEFMPNFSLDRWLHPRTDDQCHKLSTVHLLNIVVDVADALDYLHNNSQPSVIHCDLKPSNILLDSDWTAYVADFGLSKLAGESMDQSRLSSGSSVGIRGTTGYVAPEYGLGGQVSVAGDAYSFGITLLEMLTGRAPTDDMFGEGLSLHLFAEMAYPHKISEIIDPILLQMQQPYGNDDAGLDNALFSVVRIGILCSKETPSQRMNMKNAAAELHRIRDVAMESF